MAKYHKKPQVWSPSLFLEAYLNGKPVADCVGISGYAGTTTNRDSLKALGHKRLSHPAVQRLLGQREKEAEAGWTAHVSWLCSVVRGEVDGISPQEKISAGQSLGRFLAKFKDRVAVEHSFLIPYKRLVRSEDIDHQAVIDSTSMRPSVQPVLEETVGKTAQAMSDDELLAELSRRSNLANQKSLAASDTPT